MIFTNISNDTNLIFLSVFQVTIGQIQCRFHIFGSLTRTPLRFNSFLLNHQISSDAFSKPDNYKLLPILVTQFPTSGCLPWFKVFIQLKGSDSFVQFLDLFFDIFVLRRRHTRHKIIWDIKMSLVVGHWTSRTRIWSKFNYRRRLQSCLRRSKNFWIMIIIFNRLTHTRKHSRRSKSLAHRI
jgi:hypothetical protein